MQETDLPQKPMQKRALETRRKIIEAGKKIFFTEGYFNTSSKKIAKAAGVATGSFYNHFKDKKELLLEVMKEHVVEVYEIAENNFTKHDPGKKHGREFTRFIIEQSINAHKFSSEFFREIAKLSVMDEDIQQMNIAEKQRMVKMFAELLSQSRDQLRITNLEVSALLIVNLVEETIHNHILYAKPKRQKQLADELIDMIYRYVYVGDE